MWEDRLLPDINILRKKCDELIGRARQEQDLDRCCRLCLIRGYLYHDDCLHRYHWHKVRPSSFLPALGYDREEIIALEKEIEEKSAYRAKLQFTDENGKLQTREAIVDPKVESYYAFEYFGIFKIRYGSEFYSLRHDGTWELDFDAEYRYHNNNYDYTFARIVQD